MKELKQVLGLKMWQLPAPSERLARRIGAAVRRLNEHFARGVLGGRTAQQVAREMQITERRVDLQDFFEETCAAIECAVQGCTGSATAPLP